MEDNLSLRVAERAEDRGGILRLTLAASDGRELPPFEAGAHLDIRVTGEGVDLWRQYSLCGDPRERGAYRLGILKDPASRGGSRALHALARPGAVIEASAPRNHFALAEAAPRSILLAGGVGVTPMLAMAHRLHALGRDFELHYCTRSRAVTAFLEEIDAAPFRDRVRFHHDDEGTLYDPAALPAPGEGAHLYVCGPQGFMDWLIEAAERAGYPSERIHREYFSADVELSGDSFEVEARASGVTVTVGPDETIAKALERVGIAVEVKCEEGVCGTCLTTVLEGLPDHRDVFLTPEEKAENAEMTVCCSRALSARLVLDI
ncbi:PDR/VanB family oxidoreductase [Aureimonas populi]|uniref:PDR/VanB family oxidoreductase n=1 Tax=Aureimonas populi TaxID=1701758 RepID=A0ABW5CKT2_9HYPH|nr:PDR/VanB family oxidoreductase [Aureimonas populi]